MTVALQQAARKLLGSVWKRQATAAAAAPAGIMATTTATTAAFRPQQQVRYHHPDPFNPKTTRGWKAAVHVSFYDD